MQRAESSRSSSPEGDASPSYQLHSTSHPPAPTQSNTAAANREEFGSALDNRQRGPGDQIGGGDADYEAGDHAEGLRKDRDGGLLPMSTTEHQHTTQGSQRSPDNRFIDSDGDVDLNAIQEDDIRELGVEFAAQRNADLGAVNSGDGNTPGGVQSRRRRDREESKDDQDDRRSKWPRVRGG